MIRMTMFAAFLLACLVSQTAFAASDEGIAGWGPWRFGMTLEEAEIAAERQGQFSDGKLRVIYEIGGFRWVAAAAFEEPRYGGIGLINLGTLDETSDVQCRDLYAMASTRLQAKHGVGAPFDRPADKTAAYPESFEGLLFMQPDTSFVRLSLKRYGKGLKGCGVEVLYSPPTAYPSADF